MQDKTLKFLRDTEASGEPIVMTNHRTSRLKVRPYKSHADNPLDILRRPVPRYQDPCAGCWAPASIRRRYWILMTGAPLRMAAKEPAERMIVATSHEIGTPPVTADAKVRGYPTYRPCVMRRRGPGRPRSAMPWPRPPMGSGRCVRQRSVTHHHKAHGRHAMVHFHELVPLTGRQCLAHDARLGDL